MIMLDDLNVLLKLMQQARVNSDNAKTKAHDHKQIANELKVEAKLAKETANLALKIVEQNKDASLRESLVSLSLEASKKAENAESIVDQALKEANLSDKEVIEAFLNLRQATDKMAASLYKNNLVKKN
jgi:hypothetical protein